MLSRLKYLGLVALLCGCIQQPRNYAGQSRMETLTMDKSQVLHAQAQECVLTLQGPFAHLLLQGRDNHVQLKDRVELLEIDGSGNSVECNEMPGRVRLRGSGNVVTLDERPGKPRPPVDVQGNNQAIKFRPPR